MFLCVVHVATACVWNDSHFSEHMGEEFSPENPRTGYESATTYYSGLEVERRVAKNGNPSVRPVVLERLNNL